MTGRISIRFYEELNDFLPPHQRKKTIEHEHKESRSVKDLIESLGVPHTEIDLILVNGRSVDFEYVVKEGDRISVYPMFESLDISPVTKLRPQPLRDTRFIADSHLGRLSAYLRMLGFDTLYRNDCDDPTLARISVEDKRILLTCDKRLLMRKLVTHGYYVRERQPQRQLLEIISRFDLFNSVRPFTRCIHCNGIIHQIDKNAIEQYLMPRTKEHYNEFWQCKHCQKIYWKGSHYSRMQQLIDQLDLNSG